MTQSTDHHGQGVLGGVSRRLQLTILLGVAVLLLAVWGAVAIVGVLTERKPVAQVAPPPGTFRPTAQQWGQLTLAPVRSRDFAAALDMDGKVATDDDLTTQVFSPYSGRVTRVYAKAGDRVTAGAPLFAVQATEFIQAQTDLVSAVATLTVAQAAAIRQAALFKIQGAALKDVQQSQADLANAQSGLESVRNRLRILGQTDQQIDGLQQRSSAQPMSNATTVSAPIGGVVVQRAIGAGQTIGSVVNNGGSTPAFTISDLRTVWLVANAPEASAGALKLGAPISARLTAFPGRSFSGRVNFIAPAVDPNTRRIVVRATVDNPDGALRPEMFADVSLGAGPAVAALSVPESAVIYEGEQARVWIARADKTLELRLIAVGRTHDGVVEVLKGLQPGQQVVDAGAIFIDRAATND